MLDILWWEKNESFLKIWGYPHISVWVPQEADAEAKFDVLETYY